MNIITSEFQLHRPIKKVEIDSVEGTATYTINFQRLTFKTANSTPEKKSSAWVICTHNEFNTPLVAQKLVDNGIETRVVLGGYNNFLDENTVKDMVFRHLLDGGLLVAANDEIADNIKTILSHLHPKSSDALDRNIIQLEKRGTVNNNELSKIKSKLLTHN